MPYICKMVIGYDYKGVVKWSLDTIIRYDIKMSFFYVCFEENKGLLVAFWSFPSSHFPILLPAFSAS